MSDLLRRMVEETREKRVHRTVADVLAVCEEEGHLAECIRAFASLVRAQPWAYQALMKCTRHHAGPLADRLPDQPSDAELVRFLAASGVGTSVTGESLWEPEHFYQALREDLVDQNCAPYVGWWDIMAPYFLRQQGVSSMTS